MKKLPLATKVTIEHDVFAVDIFCGNRTLFIGPEVSPGMFFARSDDTVGVVPAEQLGMLLDCAATIGA